MAERKAVNKYYPPDWDPSKGSINQYVGQHPLRDRAKKLGQGILVIRFELPYNIWCGGCNSHVGMGVRYNAEKKKVGNYYSTPIYKFRMKCHLCDNYFEIQTDPKNHDYVILNGARRKEQRWDPKDNEQVVTDDKAKQKKLATDAMFKLEHGEDDKKKQVTGKASLASIEQHRSQYKDDYMLNKLARGVFREEKKKLKKQAEKDRLLLEKTSLDIPLVPEDDSDVRLSSLIKYSATESYDEVQKQKRKEIEARPLFGTSTSDTSTDKHAKGIFNLKSKVVGTFNSPVSANKPSISGNTFGIRRKARLKQKVNCCLNHTDTSEVSSTQTLEKALDTIPTAESSSSGIRCDRKPSLEESTSPVSRHNSMNVLRANCKQTEDVKRTQDCVDLTTQDNNSNSLLHKAAMNLSSSSLGLVNIYSDSSGSDE